jgi:hypothetical protein
MTIKLHFLSRARSVPENNPPSRRASKKQQCGLKIVSSAEYARAQENLKRGLTPS